MIESMTGFGCGEASDDSKTISVEVKCVNHRYFDTNIKMPRSFAKLESQLVKYLKEHLRRGRVDVYISFKNTGVPTVNVNCNEDLAKKYFSAVNVLGESLGFSDTVSINSIIKMPDVLVVESVRQDVDDMWGTISGALSDAVLSVLDMRRAEGKSMISDISSRLDVVEKTLAKIEGSSQELLETYKDRLLERLKILQKNMPDISDERLLQELVIYSDRSDISEELVRSQSHLAQIRKLFDSSESVGRKMDFIIQELNREINTIGSKSSGSSISEGVVSVKVELEKIREQIQNIL